MRQEGLTMLEGFKRYDIAIGTSSVSITDNGIAFSKAAIIRMEKPEYVIFLIDKSGKKIAIQKAEKNDDGATQFYTKKKNISVRWNNKDLLKTIAEMMNWELSGNIYKVEGEYISAENAMIFDLKNAVQTKSK